MKLVLFTPDNLGSVASGRPIINFARNGHVSISIAAVRLLKLGEGERVVIAQDPDFPDNWYIKVCAPLDTSGFAVRRPSGQKSLYFASSKLAKMFLAHFNLGKSVSVVVGDDPVKGKTGAYYPLITAALAHKK
jgi:hypothetical protein